MDSTDRAETITAILIWLIGLALFVWAWQVSGSFVAAVITTVVGGLFLALLAWPLLVAAVFILVLAADLIWPPRSRH